jgi:hypothetical protein
LDNLKFKRVVVTGTTDSVGAINISNPTNSLSVFLLRNTYTDDVIASFGVINIENITNTYIRIRFRTLSTGEANINANISTSLILAYFN